MKKVLFILGTILLFIVYNGCSNKVSNKKSADLVIRNATIYKVDSDRSWAQALAVSDGLIIFVGSNKNVEQYIGENTNVIDAKGRLLLPGFHDSHAHPVEAGLQLNQCNLNEAKSIKEITEIILDYVKNNPEKPWIIGRGWDQTLFVNTTPNKSILDSIVKDKPVMLWDNSSHDIWLNSVALKIANITSKTPDTNDGTIARDPITNEPTGTLREKAAFEFVDNYMPETTLEEYCEAIITSLKIANSLGIISINDALGKPGYINAYAEIEKKDKLTSRIHIAQEFKPDINIGKQLIKFNETRIKYNSKKLNTGTIKMFIDGVFASKTVALLKPYEKLNSNEPDYFGTPIFNTPQLNHYVSLLDAEGFQVHMHTIGGKAIRMGLEAIEQARVTNGTRDSRHIMVHLTMIHPNDIARFQKLGIVAVVHPLWANTVDYNMVLIKNHVGGERFKQMHSFKTQQFRN